jgi:hypothetical protein
MDRDDLTKHELINLICGRPAFGKGTYTKFTGNQWNEEWDWDRDKLDKLSEAELYKLNFGKKKPLKKVNVTVEGTTPSVPKFEPGNHYFVDMSKSKGDTTITLAPSKAPLPKMTLASDVDESFLKVTVVKASEHQLHFENSDNPFRPA